MQTLLKKKVLKGRVCFDVTLMFWRGFEEADEGDTYPVKPVHRRNHRPGERDEYIVASGQSAQAWHGRQAPALRHKQLLPDE